MRYFRQPLASVGITLLIPGHGAAVDFSGHGLRQYFVLSQAKVPLMR